MVTLTRISENQFLTFIIFSLIAGLLRGGELHNASVLDVDKNYWVMNCVFRCRDSVNYGLLTVISAMCRVRPAVDATGADTGGCRRATQWGWWCGATAGCHGDGAHWVWQRVIWQRTAVCCYWCREELLKLKWTKQHIQAEAQIHIPFSYRPLDWKTWVSPGIWDRSSGKIRKRLFLRNCVNVFGFASHCTQLNNCDVAVILVCQTVKADAHCRKHCYCVTRS